VLELQNLSRRFGTRWVVQGLTANLLAGQVVGFLGPNGAGKTTSIKMIAGLLVPSQGRIVLDGIDTARQPEQAKMGLAYIPDRPYVPERLSARELLAYVAGLYGLDPAVVDGLGIQELHRFGLRGREDDLLGTYSHGMRQRVLLAAALMRRPKVLLVDEPMVGLDPQGMRLVKRVLREVADGAGSGQGAVVLMSTHTLDVVEEVCDRVLVMGKGKLVGDGTVNELKARLPAAGPSGAAPTLEDLFIALTGSSDEVSDPGVTT
jgi:ABC-2 type transport system ATP-binding protein